jgi:hypothetical protein
MFDFEKTGSVSRAVKKALTDAMTPRFGGQIVQELVTMETKSEPRYLYRLADGYIIERCDFGCYVSRIGRPEDSFLVDVEMIERAGDEWADTFSIIRRAQEDELARLPTAPELDMEFDDVFLHMVPLHNPIAANMNAVGDAE